VSGGNAGATPAQDAALQIEEYRILNRGITTWPGNLQCIAHVRQTRPALRRMADAIKGYDTRK